MIKLSNSLSDLGYGLEEYTKYIKEYIGHETLEDQLMNILSTDNISSMFKLYVYMKALFIFYVDDLIINSPKLLKELLNKFDGIKKIQNKNSHPWEMIYKYAAFCCLKIGNKEYNDKAEEYYNLAKTTLGNINGGILQKIIEEIDIQYKSVKDGKGVFENTMLTFMYR